MEVIEHSYKNKSGKTITASMYSRRKVTKEVIIHCSATPEGKDYTVDTINSWHNARGFTGIGYNYVIYRDGSIHRGRPNWASGAHTTGHNSKSVGICYVGGLSADGKTAKDTRTEAQKKSMYWLVGVMMRKYGLTLDNVHGHYEFAAKACPSFKMATFKDEYKEYVK